MNATWIVTVFVIIDDVMEHLNHRSHPLANVPDAELLAVAVVAAKYGYVAVAWSIGPVGCL